MAAHSGDSWILFVSHTQTMHNMVANTYIHVEIPLHTHAHHTTNFAWCAKETWTNGMSELMYIQMSEYANLCVGPGERARILWNNVQNYKRYYLVRVELWCSYINTLLVMMLSLIRASVVRVYRHICFGIYWCTTLIPMCQMPILSCAVYNCDTHTHTL